MLALRAARAMGVARVLRCSRASGFSAASSALRCDVVQLAEQSSESCGSYFLFATMQEVWDRAEARLGQGAAYIDVYWAHNLGSSPHNHHVHVMACY